MGRAGRGEEHDVEGQKTVTATTAEKA